MIPGAKNKQSRKWQQKGIERKRRMREKVDASKKSPRMIFSPFFRVLYPLEKNTVCQCAA